MSDGVIPTDVSSFFDKLARWAEAYPELLASVNGTVLFKIRGCGTGWVAPSATPPVVGPGGGQVSVPRADVTVEFASAGIFMDFNHGKLPLKRAILTRKFRVSGQLPLLQDLHTFIIESEKRETADAAAEPAASAAYAPGAGGSAGSQPGGTGLWQSQDVRTKAAAAANRRGGWVPDAAAPACAECGAKFSFTTRRHHCRRCGSVVCAECRTHSAEGAACCDVCWEALGNPRPLRLQDILGPSAPLCELPRPSRQPDGAWLVVPLATLVKQAVMKATAATVAAQSEQDAGSTSGHSSSAPAQARRSDAGSSTAHPRPARTASGPAVTAEAVASVVAQPLAPAAAAGGSGAAVRSSEAQEAASSNMDKRLGALEARLYELQGDMHAASLATGGTPSLWSAGLSSELLATVGLATAYLVGRAGWLVLALPLAWAGLASLWAGSWLFGLLVLAGTGYLAWATTSTSPGGTMFRRRMRVYGLAITMLADYKLMQWQWRLQRGMSDSEQLASGGSTLEDGAGDLDDSASIGGDSMGSTAGAAPGPADVDVLVAAEEGAWRLAHRRNAARMLALMTDLRGLWVKLGQYLSSRPDIMPQQYMDALARLQDGMPARPLAEVQATLTEDLKLADVSELERKFASIEPTALAAASIGQVHRGIMQDGSTVAIKVQHRGMREILSQDLTNMGVIMSWASYTAPELNIQDVLEEWTREVTNELHFDHEAQVMTEVRGNLARAGLPVTLPRVLPDLVGPRVLVMRFVKGIKASDGDALDAAGVDRETIVARICEAYAQQIYVDGLFNGDPHPGNILIARRRDLLGMEPHPESDAELLALLPASARAAVQRGELDAMVALERAGLAEDYVPVLLDFGLTKRLNTQMRCAFGKLVVAGEELDYAMLLEAFDEMGMVFSNESASEDMENLQYMFRDAAPAAEARAARAKRDADKAAAKAAGKVEERKLNAWPRELMLFLRASELLQGLCSALNTRHRFMHTMATAARRGLVARLPVAQRVRTAVYPPMLQPMEHAAALPTAGQASYADVCAAMPPPAPAPARGWTAIERPIGTALATAVHAGWMRGVQAAVVQATSATSWKALADVAAGVLGPLDMRPVTPATLFPTLGLSRLVVAAGCAQAVRAGQAAGWATPIAPLLAAAPELTAADLDDAGELSRVSLAAVATCRTGAEAWAPEHFTTNALAGVGWGETLRAALASTRHVLRPLAAEPSGAVPRLVEPVAHLWYGWGWLAAAVLTGIASKSSGAATPHAALCAAVSELCAKPYGVGNEIACGAPEAAKPTCESGTAERNQADATAAAAYQGHPVAVLELASGEGSPLGSSTVGDTLADEPASASEPTARSNTSGEPGRPPTQAIGWQRAAKPGSRGPDSAVHIPFAAYGQDEAVEGGMSAAMAALEMAEVMEPGLQELSALAQGGREYLCDPRLFNAKRSRASPHATVGMRASARALAAMVAQAAAGLPRGGATPENVQQYLGLRPLGPPGLFGATALGGHALWLRTGDKPVAGVVLSSTMHGGQPGAPPAHSLAAWMAGQAGVTEPVQW